MNSQSRQQTDPAREFARLALFLLQIEHSSSIASYKSIHNSLRGDNRNRSVWRAYDIGAKRAEDLVMMIANLASDLISGEERGKAMVAAYNIGRVFMPDNYFRDWGTVASECLSKNDIITLQSVSSSLSQQYPLPMVKSEEIAILIVKLKDAAYELEINNVLPPWAVLPLIRGVDDLLFVIQNFDIFGHDEAVSRTLTLIATANHSLNAASRTRGQRVALAGLCAALVLAVDLFAAGPNVLQAYATYRGWVIDAMEAVKPLLTSPLQLEGRKQPGTEDSEEV